MYFYDTNVLLEERDAIFNSGEKFFISSITDKEIESIKTSDRKTEEVRYNARKLAHLINDNEDKYIMVRYKTSFLEELAPYELESTPDNKIIACAYQVAKDYPDLIFCTNDISCRNAARDVGLNAELYNSVGNKEEYHGYKEVDLNDVELAEFYSEYSSKNCFGLLENQYLIIKQNGIIIDKYKWADGTHVPVPFRKFESTMFGKIGPINNDIYQQLAMDMLASNKISVLRGPAGSGKSYLAMSYIFSLYERGRIDKIIVFCNTVATKGAARLGFYPGSRVEKLLDSQIGNFLNSKIDKIVVEDMIDKGHLILLPLSDIRGYDTSGMNAAVYITEAQNMDTELMKLSLQRIGEDSICILDGDSDAQVDLSCYDGAHNGLRRVTEVFPGEDFYGQVDLKNIYRSKIAKVAEKL